MKIITKKFRYLKRRWLFWGWISRIHTAYRGKYLHFSLVKSGSTNLKAYVTSINYLQLNWCNHWMSELSGPWANCPVLTKPDFEGEFPYVSPPFDGFPSAVWWKICRSWKVQPAQSLHIGFILGIFTITYQNWYLCQASVPSRAIYFDPFLVSLNPLKVDPQRRILVKFEKCPKQWIPIFWKKTG